MPDQEPKQKPTALDELANVPNVEDVQQPDVIFGFKGAWLPSIDATLIGPENFQELVNLRYNDAAIEGVTGYTFRNETAITDYTTIKSGIHLKTQGRTTEDYVLVQAVNPDGNQGRIYVNKTAIGSTGNFASSVGARASGSQETYLYQDVTTGLLGRFSQAPSGHVAYANGREAIIWGGEELPIAAAFLTSDQSDANPIDVTDRLTNSRTDANNVVTLYNSSNSADESLVIMTVRPVQGFKIYISSANTSASALTVNYWNGSAYAAVGNKVDNTDTGPALAQTGTVTFNSTVTTAKLKHFQERYLYAYQIYMDAGNAGIYQITCDAPAQVPSNVWDGIYRTPIQCQVYTKADAAYEDFTLHVSESSNVGLPVGCIMDGFVNGADEDQLIIMFDEPMAGLRMTMLGNLINKATVALTVNYWNGTAWATTSATDGTAVSGKTLAQSGLISWNPPDAERKKTMFNTQGYAYQLITATNPITGTKGEDEEVVIDIINGVPKAAQINTYSFPVMYKNKLMLCGYQQGNEGNRIDYSVDNAPDIFNGEESSLDGYQSIYVGGSEYLTCGTQLYNRFGSNLFTSLALFKNNELYLLTGDGPIDYKLYPVSFKIGCPAPQSLVTAEVGFELGEDVARNVAIFVSNSGPMMYDGAVLYPIRGLEKYFDSNETGSVNFTYLNTAQGWFDSAYKEYNILLPLGASTTLNSWFCYDIVRKKWYQKDTGSADAIQCGFSVSASNGDQYIYGGTLIGKLAQLELGTAWGSTAITNTVRTGDFFPTKNEWDISRIRRLKLGLKRINESNVLLNYYHYKNAATTGGFTRSFVDITALNSDSGTAGLAWADALTTDSGDDGLSWVSETSNTLNIGISGGSGSNSSDRVVRFTIPLNEVAWCHSFKFSYTSSVTAKGIQPLLWGVQYEFVRKDHNDL